MDHLYIPSRDGTRLHLVRWTPEGESRGHVILCHGLAEHMGRYSHVAERLVKDGWQVSGIELRGHGDSEGKRGHVNRWSEYIDDLKAAAETVNGPHFLLGHSMGGAVILDALRTEWPWPLRGILLSNPALGFAVEAPAWKIKLAGFLSRVFPTLSLGNEIDTQYLSRDTTVVEAYRKDPRVFKTITPRWYTEALAAITRIMAYAPSYKLPAFFLTSTADHLCDHTATVAFIGRYGEMADHTCYGALYHELFNEPEKERILDDVCAWLAKHQTETP